MALKWFVQSGEKVEGPFTTDDVEERLRAGHFTRNSLIWGPGSEAWQNMLAWQQGLAGMNNDTVINHNFAPIEEQWHYATGGQSHGPMSRDELMVKLKQLSSGEIMLWTKGMKEWAPLYEFHDLLSECGINKRQYPRADVNGKVVLKSNGTTMIAPLVSISEGGFGVAIDSGYVTGESITAEIQTQIFHEQLNVKAEVRYVGHGVIGFKFTQINSENKGAIIQYIKHQQTRFPIKAA